MDFTLRQLAYVVAVAETRSFRQAAAQCHVSQPALSAQIAELEGRLGVALFERDRRRVLMTTAGEVLVAQAQAVLLAAGDLAEAARRLNDPMAGLLRLGVIPTVAPYFLPDLMPMLRDRYPHLTVHWTEDKTEVLLDRLQAGKLDGVCLARVAGMAELATAEIAADRFVLAGPPGHALLVGTGDLSGSDLHEQRILLLEDGHCFRGQALALCANAGAQEAAFRATSLSTLAQMVVGGAGITLLPELALAVENRRGELVIRRFPEPQPQRSLVLAWRPASPVGASLQALSEVMLDAYRQRPDPPLAGGHRPAGP